MGYKEKLIFEIGPFPNSVETKIDSYLIKKGSVLLSESKDISDNFSYRERVKTYWHDDFGIYVKYEPNVEKRINSIEIILIGNGRFPSDLEKDLIKILKSEQKSV